MLGDFDSFERSEISTSNAKNGVCILVEVFLVRRDESPENYCHSPGVVVVVVVVVIRRQKL